MPLPSDPHQASAASSPINITYPFRLRHSHGPIQQPSELHPAYRPGFQVSGDRPSSPVFLGTSPDVTGRFEDEDEDGHDQDQSPVYGLPRPLPAACRAPARFSHASSASGRASLTRSSPDSPSSADFPIIPSRPPLRPTVSFGGVSQISYYSNLSAEHELESRSVSLARAEEESFSLRSASKWSLSAASLGERSLRKARSFACVWPEARRKGRRG